MAGLVAAAGFQVGDIGGDLLVTLPLQDLEDVATEVDPGVIPAAKQRARQVIDGVDDGSGVRQDPLFDADDLIPHLDAEVPCQLFACAGGVDLDAVCMRIAAEAADQRIVFQFLVQSAAQVEHGAVDNGANAAHTLNVSGALHLAQRVPDHGTADTEFRGQIDLGGQAVSIGVATGAQFFQKRRDDTVTDDRTAQADG